jgi:SAM-dependent methyltransferase
MVTQRGHVAYNHLFGVVNAEFQKLSDLKVIRILEIGCGNGELLAHLVANTRRVLPSATFECFGFDVHDFGTQSEELIRHSIEFLSQLFPDIPWSERISAISVGDAWPYPDSFFDLIVSNHVLEHVEDHAFVFSEIRRTLKEDRSSVHLFPLKHSIHEGHLHLPFAHWFGTHDMLIWYIKFMSRLGLGKYNAKADLDEWAERHADFVFHFTNYITCGELIRLAKASHLRLSFKYTADFYTCKLRSLLRLQPRACYSTERWALLDWCAAALFKYIHSVTVTLEKKEIFKGRLYRRYKTNHGPMKQHIDRL